MTGFIFAQPLSYFEERPGKAPPRRLSARMSWQKLNVPYGAVIVVEFAPVRGEDVFRFVLSDDSDSSLFHNPSASMQVESLIVDMSDLADLHPQPARVKSVLRTMTAVYSIHNALMPGGAHDLRHIYRLAARGRKAPATYPQWLEDWASGTWSPDFVWGCELDAPSFTRAAVSDGQTGNETDESQPVSES
ncbi:hypothetical protein H9P43_007333 [Blastocladiella emersonii ATCC 22665]|nr:hypothetical protein H9P43_007333 [Blastocladiella emersonii ATCC 22665]